MIQSFWDFDGKHVGELIAVCALGLTVYQAYLARSHNKLSVRPHLTQFTHRDKRPSQGVLVYRILNNGVGPAFIKSFEIFLDGQLVTDPDQALATVLPARQYNHSVTRLGNDYAMAAGEAKDILILALPLGEGDTLKQIEEKLNRFDLVIEYESAYKEPGRLDTRTEKQSANKALKPTQIRST